MAQSSDNNNSNGNNDLASADAEQILDSIIGHIEKVDEPSGENTSVAKDVEPNEKPAEAIDTQQSANVAATSKTDLDKIEARAAQLATMLGGAGLSYSAGAKKHLSKLIERDERDGKVETPVVQATIHDEDLHMDEEALVVSAQQSPTDKTGSVGGALASEQEQHINEWQADADKEQGEHEDVVLEIEVSTALIADREEQVETLGAEEQIIENPADQPIVIGGGQSELATQVDHQKEYFDEFDQHEGSPDLLNIEQQIEALSLSMKEQGGQADELEAEDHAPVQPRVESDEAGFSAVDTRVSSLETQIIQLLDKVALSEKVLNENVAKTVRSETEKAVQDALASSDLIGSIRTELNSLGEDRRNQEQRMTDSLDVLHDALKDIGDRMKSVEGSTPVERVGSTEPMSSGRGIASSVLSAQLMSNLTADVPAREDENEGLEKECEVISPASAQQDDDLPTWLEDATQDLHHEKNDAPTEHADVFASAPVEADEQDEDPLGRPEEKNIEHDDLPEQAVVNEQSAITQKQPQEETLQDDTPEVGHALDTRHSLAPTESVNEVETAVSTSELHNESVVEPPVKIPSQKETNFLNAARAAARAANERARIAQEEIDTAVKQKRIGLPTSSFIAAAKQKLQEEKSGAKKASAEKASPALQPNTPANTPAKNSLFQDKVEGPNSLLVFTSLILFGTSALLLYGMSKNGDDSGSVTTLNAIEKKTDQIGTPVLPVIVKQVKATPKIKPKKSRRKINKKRLSKKRRNKKRSGLEGYGNEIDQTGYNVADAGVSNSASTTDTLTTHDRLVKGQMAELSGVYSSINITGSLSKRGKKTSSLFDEYVGFSGSSNHKAISGSSLVSASNVDGKISHDKGVPAKTLTLASNGDALAQYEVARRFGKGHGVQKSPAISVEWYEKSAKAGYAPAIYRLATMYERGNGVTKDYKKAMQLYLEAAGKGNVKAMHNLAVLYTGGNLGKADYVNAIKWYGQAAEYGVKDSQFNLAIIYQNGMGSKQNLDKAYKWYSLAARSGDPEAHELKQDLREELPAAKLRELDAELATWSAKIADKDANSSWKYSQSKSETKVANVPNNQE